MLLIIHMLILQNQVKTEVNLKLKGVGNSTIHTGSANDNVTLLGEKILL